jgi:hypothetical protein
VLCNSGPVDYFDMVKWDNYSVGVARMLGVRALVRRLRDVDSRSASAVSRRLNSYTSDMFVIGVYLLKATGVFMMMCWLDTFVSVGSVSQSCPRIGPSQGLADNWTDTTSTTKPAIGGGIYSYGSAPVLG